MVIISYYWHFLQNLDHPENNVSSNIIFRNVMKTKKKSIEITICPLRGLCKTFQFCGGKFLPYLLWCKIHPYLIGLKCIEKSLSHKHALFGDFYDVNGFYFIKIMNRNQECYENIEENVFQSTYNCCL